MDTTIRLARHLLLAGCLASFAEPAGAALNLPGIGIPQPTDPGFDVDPTPDPEPLPPAPEPLVLSAVGNDWFRIVTNPGPGSHQLFRQPNGGAWSHLRSVPANTRSEFVDGGLAVGATYCYRLDSTNAGATQSRYRCAATDWRVGFSERHFSPEATRRVLDLFDWRATRELPVGEELPALYYMNVLVDDVAAPDALRGIGVHVQAAPVFGEEAAGWTASSTLVVEGDEVVGRWYYAVVPGHFYNEIRRLVLAQLARGEAPGLRALVFRQIPDARARELSGDGHRLAYRYLGERGFAWNGEVKGQCVYDEALRGEVCPYLLGWVVRKLAGWIAEGAESLVEAVRTGIGRFQRIYTEEVRLSAEFQVLNTDSAFGTDRPMRSGWSGRILRLQNVRVHVRQGIAAFYGTTDRAGQFQKTVLKDVDTQLCVEAENHVVMLTEFLTEETICFASIGKLEADWSEVVRLRHPYLNVLAGVTDAYDYLRDVVGYTPGKVTFLVGGLADRVALAGLSFAPCMGRVPSLLGVLGDVFPTASPIEFLTAVDVVLRSDVDDSRGVAVHEYGHTVMCSLLAAQGLATFEIAWTGVIRSITDKSAENETFYLSEAFADFLTSQVLGGVNYFEPEGSVLTSGISYCIAGSRCVEENVAEAATDNDQVARIVGLLHDAFDGRSAEANDGTHWRRPSHFEQFGARDSDEADEDIELPARDLRRLFDYWDARGNTLNEKNLLGGLADLLVDRGYGEAEICRLFATHDPTGSCPSWVSERPWLAWLLSPTSPGSDLFDVAAPAPAPGFALPAAWAAGVARPDAVSAYVALPGEPGFYAPAGETGAEPSGAHPIAVVEGVQKVKVRGLGKEKRGTAFAFRIGEGWWEGIDPLGQPLGGGWSLRGRTGAQLRLHLAPEFDAQLEALLAQSLPGLGGSIAPAGPPRIQLKLRGDGRVAAKIRVAFSASIDGETREGVFVAKLWGEAH